MIQQDNKSDQEKSNDAWKSNRKSDSAQDKSASGTGRGTVTSLQQTVGNQAVQRLYEEGEIRGKVTISQPNDPAEREAEQVSEEILGMSEEEATSKSRMEIDRKGASGNPTIGSDTKQEIESVTSGGKSLPPATRSFLEPRFGRNFSDVRVHTGSKADEAARSINARAFTYGKDIVFQNGEYQPNTRQGKELLAHELTHVEQQRGESSREIRGWWQVIGAIAAVAALAMGGTKWALDAMAGDIDLNLTSALEKGKYAGPPVSGGGRQQKNLKIGKATLDAWVGEGQKDMGIRFTVGWAHFDGKYLGDVHVGVIDTYDAIGWGGKITVNEARLVEGQKGKYLLSLHLEDTSQQYMGNVQFEVSPTGFSTGRSGEANLAVVQFNSRVAEKTKTVPLQESSG